MGGSPAIANKGILIQGRSEQSLLNPHQQLNFIWKIAFSPGNTQFRADSTPADLPASNATIFSTNNGNPSVSRSGKTHKLVGRPSDVARLYQLPGLVLALNLANAKITVTQVQDTGSSTLVHIRLQDSSQDVEKDVSLQDWY